jgi:pimeloyl-ACP methyl ester carboxylesterase
MTFVRTWGYRLWETWSEYWLAMWWWLRVPWLRTPPEHWSKGHRDPVVLLPGVYESWSFMRSVGEHLHRAGHPVYVVPELRRNIDTIPDAAAIAQRTIDQLGLQRVALVAHSKGGLIGKHMMAFDDTEHRIRSLTAIATPFGGSRMARYMPVRTLRAFLPTDATITTLAANLALNARITSVYGQWDAHIPDGSVLDGATNVELPVIGHFRVLRDRRVLDAVADAVERGAADVEPGVR